ncbi:hypothetical protein ACOSP7_005013 [Xanthoceras sorbifolium]
MYWKSLRRRRSTKSILLCSIQHCKWPYIMNPTFINRGPINLSSPFYNNKGRIHNNRGSINPISPFHPNRG